jgi:hypothetical protein
VAAERERIHQQSGRIGHLHQCDLVAGQIGHRRNRIAAHTGMETIQHQSEIGPIGQFDEMPGLHPVLDMGAPGQRLVPDPQAARTGPIRQFCKVAGGLSIIVDRLGADIGAQAKEIDAQFVHQVEFALGTFEIAQAGGGRHALEVAHRLQGDNRQAQILGHAAHIAGPSVEEGQIILEQFDSAKACFGNG